MGIEISDLTPEEYHQMTRAMLEKKVITIGEYHLINEMIRIEIKLDKLISRSPLS